MITFIVAMITFIVAMITFLVSMPLLSRLLFVILRTNDRA
jgi:hypothetical protein